MRLSERTQIYRCVEVITLKKTMNLTEIIRTLQVEKARVEDSIAALEALEASKRDAVLPGRRGRKSMGAEERQQVSERMKRYWESRRMKQASSPTVGSD